MGCSFFNIPLRVMYLRIFSGSFKPGEVDEKPAPKYMWSVAAAVMVIPIIMVVVSILLPIGPLSNWLNFIIVIGFILFNLAGIKGYKPFDVFLLIVSFGFNGLTIFFTVRQLWF